MRSVPVLIIGGGASGLAAAIAAAEQGDHKFGKKIVLLEKMNRVGKKILATGNGKCNFTNEKQEPACYRSENPAFAWQVVQSFDHQKTLQWFHQLGILPKARAGYYYPASGQASSILEALRRRVQQLGISVHTEEAVSRIQKSGQGFLVETTKDSYMARTVILACGGAAAPVHGTSGDGYGLAKSLGLTIVEPRPALTSLVLRGTFMKEWTGVRVLGQVSLYDQENQLLAQDRGELQMVGYGISGIPVFQISRFAAKAAGQGKKVHLKMDIFPENTVEEVYEELSYRRQQLASLTLWDGLDGMLHRKLAHVCMRSCGLSERLLFQEVSDQQLMQLTRQMKEWKLEVESVSDFDKAQVTCGGVSVLELEECSLESKQVPGLYVTGELVDVDGICGGYNLQWAWTSGILAGQDAARKAICF